MTTFASGAFYTLALGGTLAALVGVAIFSVKAVRLRDPDYPGAITWKYTDMGLGLVLASAALWLVRTLSTGSMPAVSDALGLIAVLAVASAGFGTCVAWAGIGERWKTARVWPLVLSTLMGVCGGLSAIAF